MHTIINGNNFKHGGNWINVSTYWKDHIEDIINLEEIGRRIEYRQGGTSILKDQ